MAHAIAGRLLHEPTLRLRRSADDEAAFALVAALRELFGLDAETEPMSDAADVRELRRSEDAG